MNAGMNETTTFQDILLYMSILSGGLDYSKL